MSTAAAIMPNTQTSGQPGNNCFPLAREAKQQLGTFESRFLFRLGLVILFATIPFLKVIASKSVESSLNEQL